MFPLNPVAKATLIASTLVWSSASAIEKTYPVDVAVLSEAQDARQSLTALDVARAETLPTISSRPEPFSTTPNALKEVLTQNEQQTTKGRSEVEEGEKINGSGARKSLPPGVQTFSGEIITDASWVLTPAQKPWEISYYAPSSLTHIVIMLPSVNELKLLLPGQVSDVIDRTRSAVNKYIQDSIGVATQFRRKQLERVRSWISNTQAQQKTLPDADWPQYQFSYMAHKTAKEFMSNVEVQSHPSVEFFIQEAQQFVERFTPLMAVMPTHEMRQAAYAIMVRLQEGVGLYQAQIEQEDAQVLAVLRAGLRSIPALMLPNTPPPPRESAPMGGGWRPVQAQAPKTSVPSNQVAAINQQAPARNYQQPAETTQIYPPQASTITNSQENNAASFPLVGYVSLGGVGLGVFSMFRKKTRNKAKMP